MRQQIDQIADYSKRCANEQTGFSCEMAVHLDAYNKLGLLDRFTAAFGCRYYRCEEVSLCTRDRSLSTIGHDNGIWFEH